MNFIESARQGMHNILYGNQKPIDMSIPSETLRYIRDYGDVGVKELRSSILPNTEYNVFGPYFGLKLLDDNPHAQQTLLAQLANVFSTDGALTDASRVIDGFFAAEVNPTTARVSPNKLKQVMTASPAFVRENAAGVVTEIQQRDEVPVIIGYAGFLALRDVVHGLQPAQSALVVLPDKIGVDTHTGYVMTKAQDKTVMVDQLQDTSIHGGKTYALIDNTTYTGQTFKKVTDYMTQRNPGIRIQPRPLYMTRTPMQSRAAA